MANPTTTDRYLAERLLGEDPVLADVMAAARDAGLPDIAVTPTQGAFLALLVRLVGGRAVLEVGTLGAYSTIWMARALAPGGRLVTLEADPDYARVAAENLARAGVDDVVDLRVGDARETLAGVHGPFDLVFIDADKRSTPAYFARALELTRPGGLILVDNVVRAGAVADPGADDPSVRGVRAFLDLAAAEPRVTGTALQTVGEKGHDGLCVLLVDG